MRGRLYIGGKFQAQKRRERNLSYLSAKFVLSLFLSISFYCCRSFKTRFQRMENFEEGTFEMPKKKYSLMRKEMIETIHPTVIPMFCRPLKLRLLIPKVSWIAISHLKSFKCE